MVKFIRLHWFGLILSVLVVFFMIFTVIVAIAPHNDAKMRGFTPCTYQMAMDLNQETAHKVSEIFKIVTKGYVCYFGVISEGATLFVLGKQATPWANYLFVPENWEEIPEESEPFSEDLMEANILNEEEPQENFLENQVEENDNEKQ